MTGYTLGDEVERCIEGCWFPAVVLRCDGDGVLIRYPDDENEELISIADVPGELQFASATVDSASAASSPDKSEPPRMSCERVEGSPVAIVTPLSPRTKAVKEANELLDRIAPNRVREPICQLKEPEEDDLTRRIKVVQEDLHCRRRDLESQIENMQSTVGVLAENKRKAFEELSISEAKMADAVNQINNAFRPQPPAVDDRGMWIGTDAVDWHFHDSNLAIALCELLTGHSVIDLGCGMGETNQTSCY